MRDFPSCFGENGVQVADASCTSVASASKTSQNLVSSIYQGKLLGKTCLITVTWSKNLMGQCFNVEIEDLSHRCLCRMDVKPSLFSKCKGSKNYDAGSYKIDIFWDLTSAKFGSGLEPLESFYLVVVCNGEMILLVGDLRKEASKRTNAKPSLFKALCISKREHIFGKKVFNTKAQFLDDGQIHDLRIECDTAGVIDPCLVIRLDGKIVILVKHLLWKFRGNYTFLVEGVLVEVFWDVHNWLFSTTVGNAVFMFQASISSEKMWKSQTFSDPCVPHWNCTESFKGCKGPCPGFSLTLYAWKNE